jgi:hypothetical protein
MYSNIVLKQYTVKNYAYECMYNYSQTLESILPYHASFYLK